MKEMERIANYYVTHVALRFQWGEGLWRAKAGVSGDDAYVKVRAEGRTAREALKNLRAALEKISDDAT